MDGPRLTYETKIGTWCLPTGRIIKVKEYRMKLRWLAITVGLAAFSVGPWMLAQTQTPGQSQDPQAQVPDQDKGQPKAGDVQNAPKQPPAALPTTDDSQINHNGGKTDVDAVGNRNVGCGRGVGNWYTVEGQVARGRVYAQQIESQIKLVNAPVITAFAIRIAHPLARNPDAHVP